MMYKTMILEMLQQRPQIHDQLRKDRNLLATMERYAMELEAIHEAWQEVLFQARPDSDPNQIASEALEMALSDMEDRLSNESAQESHEALSLDQAIAFIRKPTSDA